MKLKQTEWLIENVADIIEQSLGSLKIIVAFVCGTDGRSVLSALLLLLNHPNPCSVWWTQTYARTKMGIIVWTEWCLMELTQRKIMTDLRSNVLECKIEIAGIYREFSKNYNYYYFGWNKSDYNFNWQDDFFFTNI